MKGSGDRSSVMENQWRGDDTFRLGLGRLQGYTEVIKRRRDTDRQSHVESIHTQTKNHGEKQRRVRSVRSIVGRI